MMSLFTPITVQIIDMVSIFVNYNVLAFLQRSVLVFLTSSVLVWLDVAVRNLSFD